MIENSKHYKLLSLIFLFLLLINPLTIFLLLKSIWYSLLISTGCLILFLVLYYKTKTSFIYIFYLYFLISIIYHSELVFNICFPQYIIKNLYQIDNGIYFNKPNLMEVIQDKEYDINYYTNCQGFRISNKINPNTRIEKCDWLFLGDSYVQGAQVDWEDLFSSKLYRYFPNKVIINAGISGLGLIDEFKLYKRLGKKLHPQKVFVVICNFNDFMNVEENSIDFTDYLMDKSNFIRYLLFGFKYSNPASLPLGRWTEPFYEDMEANIDYNIFYRKTSEKKKKDIELFIKYLELFKNEVVKDGAEFIVIQIPTKEQVYYKFFYEVIDAFKIEINDLDMNYPNDLLSDISYKLGIKLIDLRKAFAESENEVYFQYDEHLNVYGHEAIAKEIFTSLPEEYYKAKLLTNGTSYDRYPTYYKDDNIFLFQSYIDGNFEIMESDSAFMDLTRITFNEVNESHPVMKDSLLLFSEGDQEIGELEVVIYDRRTGIREYITKEDSIFGGIPYFSNHSKDMVAYAEWNLDSTSNSRIVLYNLNTGTKIFLTDRRFECWRPIFSRDDSEIFYISKIGRNFGIYKTNIFSYETDTIFTEGYDIWDISLSKDGTKLVFAGNPDNNWDLFLLDLYSNSSTRLTKTLGDEWDPNFMNDSEIIYGVKMGFNNGICKLSIK